MAVQEHSGEDRLYKALQATASTLNWADKGSGSQRNSSKMERDVLFSAVSSQQMGWTAAFCTSGNVCTVFRCSPMSSMLQWSRLDVTWASVSLASSFSQKGKQLMVLGPPSHHCHLDIPEDRQGKSPIKGLLQGDNSPLPSGQSWIASGV